MSQSHIIGTIGKQQLCFGHDTTQGRYIPVSVSNGAVHVQNYGKAWNYSNIVSNVLISAGSSSSSSIIDLIGANSEHVHFFAKNTVDASMVFTMYGSYDNINFFPQNSTYTGTLVTEHFTSDKFCADLPRYFYIKCQESTTSYDTYTNLTVGYHT